LCYFIQNLSATFKKWKFIFPENSSPFSKQTIWHLCQIEKKAPHCQIVGKKAPLRPFASLQWVVQWIFLQWVFVQWVV
jgi:hypothetical protein